jgi:hypothetical protein
MLAPANFIACNTLGLLTLPYPKRIIVWMRVLRGKETKTERRIEEGKKTKS